MSLYPQSPTYAQMPYPAQGYGAPVPPPGASYYNYAVPPVPHPLSNVDPNMFRRDYITRLSNLTVNSRPIIQNLSMIAQDYSRYADIVVQCIDQHIRRVSHRSTPLCAVLLLRLCPIRALCGLGNPCL